MGTRARAVALHQAAEGGRPQAARVDAVGFEPTASPLQGERSTADLRAPRRGRADSRSRISMIRAKDRPSRTDGHRCLLHSVNACRPNSVRPTSARFYFV